MVKHQHDVDAVFQALADTSRRAILERLTRGPASVTELAAPLPMSMPAVLGHLRQLEASGLIRSQKHGRVRTCTLVPEALSPAEQWFADRRSAWEHRLDRLGRFLDDTAEPLPPGLDDPTDGDAAPGHPAATGHSGRTPARTQAHPPTAHSSRSTR